MKKRSLLVLFIISLTTFQSFAQVGGIFVPFYPKSQNFIPKFVDSSGETTNSILYQNGTDKIGINTENPLANLEIRNSTMEPALMLRKLSNAEYTTLEMSFYLSTPHPSGMSSFINKANIGITPVYDIRGTTVNTSLYFTIRDSEKMRIEESGNIGIGTVSPESRLHVNSGSGQTAFIAQVDGRTRFTVNSNGSISVGTSTIGPVNGMYVDGNVNIGTTSSNSRLHVNSTSGQTAFTAQVNGSNKLTVNSNGSVSVGVATTGPTNGMHVNGNVNIGTTSSSSRLQVNSTSGQDAFIAQVNGSNKLMVNSNGSVSVGSATTGPANGMYVSGSIGIGTTNVNDYKLAIAGKAIAEEVVVKLRTNWPDYVFEEDYNLKQLDEVKDYIKEYKHLPNIPTATEIEEKGISLGTINTILVEKIEELTLYLIEHQQVINELKEKVKDLENGIRYNE